MSTTRVDFTSIEGFRDSLTPMIQHVTAAIRSLTEAEQPPLGGFQDAREIAQRHAVLRSLYVTRLEQLVWALTDARIGDDELIEDYVAAYAAGIDAATDLASGAGAEDDNVR
jgi:hypothetical protein